MLHGKIIILMLLFLPLCCALEKKTNSSGNTTYKYLALGDSYTIGESVCKTCNYPQQLTDSLNEVLTGKTALKIIAKTGWTTSDLLAAIAQENPSSNYDMVTLLIGVNNQYQDKTFSLYEREFPELLNKAIAFAKGQPEKVIVLSIPDYGFTPFGQNSGKAVRITSELKKYNAFAEKTALEKGVHFENITPITQQALKSQALVASDGLHPSEIAYKKFVEQIFRTAKTILK